MTSDVRWEVDRLRAQLPRLHHLLILSPSEHVEWQNEPCSLLCCTSTFLLPMISQHILILTQYVDTRSEREWYDEVSIWWTFSVWLDTSVVCGLLYCLNHPIFVYVVLSNYSWRLVETVIWQRHSLRAFLGCTLASKLIVMRAGPFSRVFQSRRPPKRMTYGK